MQKKLLWNWQELYINEIRHEATLQNLGFCVHPSANDTEMCVVTMYVTSANTHYDVSRVYVGSGHTPLMRIHECRHVYGTYGFVRGVTRSRNRKI